MLRFFFFVINLVHKLVESTITEAENTLTDGRERLFQGIPRPPKPQIACIWPYIQTYLPKIEINLCHEVRQVIYIYVKDEEDNPDFRCASWLRVKHLFFMIYILDIELYIKCGFFSKSIYMKVLFRPPIFSVLWLPLKSLTQGTFSSSAS